MQLIYSYALRNPHWKLNFVGKVDDNEFQIEAEAKGNIHFRDIYTLSPRGIFSTRLDTHEEDNFFSRLLDNLRQVGI